MSIIAKLGTALVRVSDTLERTGERLQSPPAEETERSVIQSIKDKTHNARLALADFIDPTPPSEE